MGIHPLILIKCAGKHCFIQVVQYRGTDAPSANSKLSPADVVLLQCSVVHDCLSCYPQEQVVDYVESRC